MKKQIKTIRQKVDSDAEALAAMFEVPTEDEKSESVADRLIAILEATELPFVPGLQLAVNFSDEGFRGSQELGGAGFRDPYTTSRNQVGHFLTAVGLSFNPDKMAESFVGRPLRDWLGAPASMSNEEVALRLTIGHEKAPDPMPLNIFTVLGGISGLVGGVLLGTFGGGVLKWLGPKGTAFLGAVGGAGIGSALYVLQGFRVQFKRTTEADIAAFQQAEENLGCGSSIDIDSVEPLLQKISIDPTMRGNSIQDLRLSLVGWHLGQCVKKGKFVDKKRVADWLRDALM